MTGGALTVILGPNLARSLNRNRTLVTFPSVGAIHAFKLQAKELGMEIASIDRQAAYGDAARLFEFTSGAIAAAAADDLPSCAAKLPARLASQQGHPVLSLAPNLAVVMERHYSWLAVRRVTATALAAKWYAADRGGQLPPNLAALVPAYISRVPADPFLAGAERLIYRNDPAAAIVYSVGHNGKDDGGSDSPANIKGNQQAKQDVVVRVTAKASRWP